MCGTSCGSSLLGLPRSRHQAKHGVRVCEDGQRRATRPCATRHLHALPGIFGALRGHAERVARLRKHGRVVARQARQRGQRVRAHGLAGAARRGRQQRARERRFRKTARPRGRLRGDVADRVADVPLRAPRARLRTYPGAASRRVGVARSRAERSPCGAAEPRTRAHVTQPRSAGRTDTLPKPLPMLGFPPSVRPAAHAQG